LFVKLSKHVKFCKSSDQLESTRSMGLVGLPGKW